MISWPMKTWAEMDENPDFRSTFEEVHGKSGWDDWVQTMDLIIEDGYDEFWELNQEMSAEPQE